MLIRNPKDLASGLFLLAFGIWLAFRSEPLSLWSRGGPEAGFFPFVVAILIIGFSLIVAGRALGFSPTRQEVGPSETPGKDPGRLSRVFSYCALMLLYGLFMETLGFLIASGVLMFLILKYLEKQSWERTAVVGLSSIVVGYFLFKYLLGVPLPAGYLRWW